MGTEPRIRWQQPASILLNVASAPVLISTNKIVLKTIPCPTLLTSLHYVVTYLLTLASAGKKSRGETRVLGLRNRVLDGVLGLILQR